MVSDDRSNFGAISRWGQSPDLITSIRNYNYEFIIKEDSCYKSRTGMGSSTFAAVPGKETEGPDNIHRKTRHQRQMAEEG